MNSFWYEWYYQIAAVSPDGTIGEFTEKKVAQVDTSTLSVNQSNNIFLYSDPGIRSNCWIKFYGYQDTLYNITTSEQTAGYAFGVDATNLRVHENVNDHDIGDDEIYVSDTSTGYSSVIFNCPSNGYYWIYVEAKDAEDVGAFNINLSEY